MASINSTFTRKVQNYHHHGLPKRQNAISEIQSMATIFFVQKNFIKFWREDIPPIKERKSKHFLKIFDKLTNDLFRVAMTRRTRSLFSLTLSVPENLKNSIFDMTIIPRTLNIHNLRTTSAKSINLHTIRELIEYSFKTVRVKDNVYFYDFRDIAVRR